MIVPSLSILALVAAANAAMLPWFDPRIVNGEDAKEGEIPYQVSLQNRGSSFHFCGGSVLNENYVITASHCVDGKKPEGIKVVAGTINLSKPNIERNVIKIIMHEKYNSADSWKNDIALLKVEKPFQKSKLVAFVPLPNANDVISPNEVATVSGWGRLRQGGPTTIFLQRVNILIANQDYCKLMYSKHGYNIYDSHVCAYDPSVQKGSCNGDSGGPLTVKGKIVGLVSWAMGCALTDYPTVYTRVASHLDWIKKNAFLQHSKHTYLGHHAVNESEIDGIRELPRQRLILCTTSLSFMISDIDTSNMAVALLSLFAVLTVANAAMLPHLDPRIVNGEDAKLGEIPYQVSLQKSSGHFCGGSVLNTNYIITAAHCVEGQTPSVVKVVVGTINWQDPKNAHEVDKIIVHENYNPGDSWRNDIALLKLKTPLKLGKNIAAVTVPKANEPVAAKSPAVVSGWGRTSVGGPIPKTLQKAKLQITEQSVCEKAYKYIGNVYETHICAHDPSEIRGACGADSGGPLVVGGKLVGVVSWSHTRCALPDYPTVYTRVSSYISWINKNAVLIPNCLNTKIKWDYCQLKFFYTSNTMCYGVTQAIRHAARNNAATFSFVLLTWSEHLTYIFFLTVWTSTFN
ncbi:transmembrane protease serine 9-like [Augochlora pura]